MQVALITPHIEMQVVVAAQAQLVVVLAQAVLPDQPEVREYLRQSIIPQHFMVVVVVVREQRVAAMVVQVVVDQDWVVQEQQILVVVVQVLSAQAVTVGRGLSF